MKKYCKLLTLLVIFISFTGSLFADGFFGERIFELRVENDVGLSNNSIAIGDYLKKDLVIDLPKLAAETPDTGFEFSLYEKPTFSTKINLGSFSTRLSMGVDSLFNMNISKDLIDFLGNGNEVGEEINTKVDMVGDVFAFFDLDVKAKNSLFKYSITPSVFIPVMHIANKKSYVNISNTEDGKFIIDASVLANVYTNVSLNDPKSSISGLFGHAGFDLGGSITVPVKKYLDLSGFFRFPIVPGTLGYVANATFDCSYETSISELASGKKVSPTMSRSISKDEPAKLKLNRPLKIALGADFYPFLDFMSISAKLGMGVRNPFPQVKGESYSFMEYYLAFTINLKNILKATISTEFTDEIYIQRLVGVLNLRAFELDTGISLQSPTLTKSFSLAGLGVYIGTAFGF